jgi:hypothetical protein
VSTIVARSLEKYLSVVANLRKSWKLQRHLELWFRAEDAFHHETRLQPGIYRQRKSGLRKSVNKLQEIENDLYDEFGRCATQLSQSDLSSVEDDFESYFLMQHHGSPTRLLDWSDGALIALHFAVGRKELPPQPGSIIYVLDPYWLGKLLRKDPDRKDARRRWKEYARKHPNDNDEDDRERLYLPEKDEIKNNLLKTPATPLLWDLSHVTRRVAAQRSRFMIFGSDPDWLVKIEKARGSRLVSIIIPRGSINKIRRELRDTGITESVVYPDLDGLGRELRQMWEARR